MKVLQKQSIIPNDSTSDVLRDSFASGLLPEKQDLGILPPEYIQETAPSLSEQVAPSKETNYMITTSVHSPKSVDSAYVSNTVKEATHQTKDLLDELFL